MAKTILLLLSVLITLFNEVKMNSTDATGTPPPTPSFDNSLCNGKPNGNYPLEISVNHFLQCQNGHALCVPCWPVHLEYSYTCNQCLYSLNDPCYTTKIWTTRIAKLPCPHNTCTSKGPKFKGNLADPDNQRQFVACWEGMSTGCIMCPGNLIFNEDLNECTFNTESVQTNSLP